MQLNDIQKNFKTTMLSHPRGLAALDETFTKVFETGDIPLEERLKVYHNNIVGGLAETLILTFPLLEKLVGRDFLEHMAREFIIAHPPDTGCLNTYGIGFDRFIADFEAAKNLPYLPDMAAFEIAMTQSYYAPDDTPLRAETLGTIAPESLSTLPLKLRANIELLSSTYPLDAIRAFCQQDEGHDEKLDLNQGGVKLMIFRPTIEVQIVKLKDDEDIMLRNLNANMNLGDAVEATLSIHPDFDFQSFLQKHLELETFLNLETN